jgi:hypothetical protein
MQVGRITDLYNTSEKVWSEPAEIKSKRLLMSKIQTNAWLYELILDLQKQVSELQSQMAELQIREYDDSK